MEALVAAPTVEETTAVIVEAGTEAARDGAAVGEAGIRAAGGDVVAAKVVATGGDTSDVARAVAMAAEVVAMVTEVVVTGGMPWRPRWRPG